ncbi:hypothetical protein CC99x_012090 [Candidatus Berkiella cookevillensis]|uniref:Uncharacterized protein n=1 Tax=Candidatus Berkiella cookevillensis TaxID=437022 RepID=A0A0Q9YDY5_9GAMM|nr:hypothetical protein [Candidatus Berkiella cookevillensis]MCS5709636.1 hypothetical protein [Candidatus Berkiella cookevillensis]
MGNFIKDVIFYTIPNLMNRVVNFILGKETTSEAAKNLSCGVVKDAVVSLGAVAAKTAVQKMIPGANIAAQAAGGLAWGGLNAAVNGSDSTAVTITKGVVGAVAASLVTPVLAIPAVYASDYLVDGAISAGQKVCDFAYNQYKQSNVQAELSKAELSKAKFQFKRPVVRPIAVAQAA